MWARKDYRAIRIAIHQGESRVGIEITIGRTPPERVTEAVDRQATISVMKAVEDRRAMPILIQKVSGKQTRPRANRGKRS
jgi:hypothetical protein